MRISFCGILLPLIFLCETAYAQDGFESVRCGADVVQALRGKQADNDHVSVIEGHHKHLDLKNLGGEEISDQLNLTSWSICGKEYLLLLDKHQIIQDVLPFPNHSETSPECITEDQRSGETVITLLDNEAARIGEESLPATKAWKIDQKKRKFIELSPVSISCPRSGIITLDGGL